MKFFTHEEEIIRRSVVALSPSEKTLRTVRQIAYTLRYANNQAYCLN
jgi:hypothetical protein